MHELKCYVLKPLTLIGAINWGLIGLFNFNLVTWIFGIGTGAQIVYSIIGIAAVVWCILMFMGREER